MPGRKGPCSRCDSNYRGSLKSLFPWQKVHDLSYIQIGSTNRSADPGELPDELEAPLVAAAVFEEEGGDEDQLVLKLTDTTKDPRKKGKQSKAAQTENEVEGGSGEEADKNSRDD